MHHATETSKWETMTAYSLASLEAFFNSLSKH